MVRACNLGMYKEVEVGGPPEATLGKIKTLPED
jgi:hypothetical protein